MLELKVVKRGKKVSLSPHQIAFHLVHAEMRVPTPISFSNRHNTSIAHDQIESD